MAALVGYPIPQIRPDSAQGAAYTEMQHARG